MSRNEKNCRCLWIFFLPVWYLQWKIHSIRWKIWVGEIWAMGYTRTHRKSGEGCDDSVKWNQLWGNKKSKEKLKLSMVNFVSQRYIQTAISEVDIRLNLRALKNSMLHKNHIFRCMGKIFCVEFKRYPLKFHTKYLTHTLKDVHFICEWKSKSS